MVKFITSRGETIWVNKAHIINIREREDLIHVSLVDFGFDITQEEWNSVKFELI